MIINNSPTNDYYSVHDDLIWVVSDAHTADPVTYPNYKFIADVYVNGVQVARLKKVPLPDSLFGVFNLSPIVRNYVSAVFNPDITATGIEVQQLGLGEFNIPVQVKFGEEYGFTSYYNIVTDAVWTFYNSYNKRYLGAAKVELQAYVNTVASNAPLGREVTLNTQNYFVPYLSDNAAAVNVQVITSNGHSHSFSFTPGANEMSILNIAPGWLNGLNPGLITQGAAWYTVNINGTLLTVYIVCEAIYDIYTIHFLNQYGGFDTKLFTKVSRQTVAIEKKDFGILNYAIASDGVVTYSNNNFVVNESAHVYSSQFTEKLLLNSNFLTDEEYIWLSDLVESPMVYIEADFNSQTGFLPVKITDNNYEKKKRVNDQLTNLTINIEYGKTFNTQFR
jgi:hypothetical protein